MASQTSSPEVPKASPEPPTGAGQTGTFSPTAPRETTSGEALLVGAYAFVWIAVFVFIVVAWRRTRDLEGRLGTLERALAKVRDVAVPTTKRSADKDEKE